MFLSKKLFSFLPIVLGKLNILLQICFTFIFSLVLLAIHSSNGIPVNSDGLDETNLAMDEPDNFIDDESRFSKRRLPMEGILIGRRALPPEGILIGKRYPTEGILLGKRYPTEGILLGKRNFRFFSPKSMAYNPYEN